MSKNNLLFLECSYVERYSYFSYEYLKSTVRHIAYISQANPSGANDRWEVYKDISRRYVILKKKV